MRPLLTLLAALTLLASAAGQQETMRSTIEQYQADYDTMDRLFDVHLSEARSAAMHKVVSDWQTKLQQIGFDKLPYEDQIDYVLLRHHIKYELVELDREDKDRAEIAPLLPFLPKLANLVEGEQKVVPIDSHAIAEALTGATNQIDTLEAAHRPPQATADKAVRAVRNLQRALAGWYRFYDAYDPLFTWWVATPYATFAKELDGYRVFLTGQPPKDGSRNSTQSTAPITGIPVGRDALIEDLNREMIPYTPEELIGVAQKELVWCQDQIKQASREMGYGDDWKKALEKVKNSYVQPGEQPAMIEKLALEAIGYVRQKNLVTVPPLAAGTWRVEMMSPARQLITPFFTGGETISISFPTAEMTEEEKQMTMRGNNIYFARATVFHELIPGHYLQEFMNARYRPYRDMFGTPFWIEGGALYWEMTLYDVGFPKTPEQKIGMLFWRMHRCARVIFSLKYHLGQMTAQQCVDFLVNQIGHERANAEGEVRRSFGGDYSVLYQAAYLIGGMQLRALRHELVDGGKMTNLQFNDAILHEGDMPIEMVRVALSKPPLNRDYEPADDPHHLPLGHY